MRCYFHEELEAVAQCQRCGKGLCKECAAKYNPCYCDDCVMFFEEEEQRRIKLAESQKKQKKIDALIDTRSEYVRACIKGVIVGLVFLALGIMGVRYEGGIDGTDDIITLAFTFIFFFFVPFGRSFIKSKKNNDSWIFVADAETGAFASLLILLLEIFLSFVIGIFAFIYQTYKTFIANKNLKDIP